MIGDIEFVSMVNLVLLVKRIRNKILMRTESGHTKFLREHGIRIGKNFRMFNHNSIRIDISSPGLIEIGDNVALTADVTILSHDFCSWVFRYKYADYLPGRSMVKIGNNVYVGQRAIILRGVTIGDNVIIGAGSIVTKDIPSNSVVCGVPAKVVCDLDSYYAKRKGQAFQMAKDYAMVLKSYKGGFVKEDFWEEFGLFLHKNDNSKFVKRIKAKQLKGMSDIFLQKNNPKFSSYEDFVNSL